MWRRPLLEVRNSGGLNIMPALNGLWIDVSVTDKAGKESDTARILCVGPPSRVALPKRGDIYTVLMGWADEGLVLQGRYSFQKAHLTGDPDRGEVMSLDFRAADFVDKLKQSGRKHYDDTTFGDLVKKLGKEVDLGAEVDPDLAKVKIPYRLRWDQSPIDFLTEISEEIGGTVKPAGGKLVAMKRGGGKSGSGTAFEPILIQRRRSFGYEIEIEPRPEVGSVAGAWFDEKDGKRKLKKVRLTFKRAALRADGGRARGRGVPDRRWPRAAERLLSERLPASDLHARQHNGSGSCGTVVHLRRLHPHRSVGDDNAS